MQLPGVLLRIAGQGHSHHHEEHSHAPANGDSIVVDIPAENCGLASHGISCHCIIRKRGSREIEVRYELPVSMAPQLTAQQQTTTTHQHNHSHDNINLRGAVLHVIGDLLQSIGVALAGLLIWLHEDDPRWYIADPICTFLFSVLVLLTTKGIIRDIVHTLMERVPPTVNINQLSKSMQSLGGVRDVHDLHVWNISTGIPVLTAHVHIGHDADPTEVLQKLEAYVRGQGIDHSTIQICNPQPVDANGADSGDGSNIAGSEHADCPHGH